MTSTMFVKSSIWGLIIVPFGSSDYVVSVSGLLGGCLLIGHLPIEVEE